MKHWTQFLQDGRLLYANEVNGINDSKSTIERLKKWQQVEQNALSENEDNLLKLVSRLYSFEEINTAKESLTNELNKEINTTIKTENPVF